MTESTFKPTSAAQVRAAEALAEALAAFRATGGAAEATRIAVFNFAGGEAELQRYLAVDCYVILTGRVCEPGEKGAWRSLRSFRSL